MATHLNESAPVEPTHVADAVAEATPRITVLPAAGRTRARALGRVEASLPSLRLVQPALWPRRIGRLLLLLFLITPVVLVFAPWRQSVEGMGRVVGRSPLDREFTVEAPIYGRVAKWMVTEASIVRGPHNVEVGPPYPGDLLAILTNNDPEYLENLERGLVQVREKLATAEQQVQTYQDIATTLADVREQMIEVETNAVEVAKQKAQAMRNERRIMEVDRQTSLAQLERYKQLEPKGLVTTRDLELAQQKFSADEQKFQKVGLDLQSADLEVKAKAAKLEEVKQKTLADIAKVQADVQTAKAKIAEYRKEVLESESKIRNQSTQYVRAPRDGVIKRLLVNEGVQQLKDGEPLALLVPQTPDLAVELYLDGNDLPLVREGDPVRLQFEGFPAFQLTGWPSVAVGTYPGRVDLIDPGDSGKGKFRVLVVPDTPEAWPRSRSATESDQAQLLRQGLQAKGWVLLRQVPLGLEVWRRLNGFPPFVAPEDAAAGKGGSKGYGDASRADPGPVEAKEKIKAKRPK